MNTFHREWARASQPCSQGWEGGKSCSWQHESVGGAVSCNGVFFDRGQLTVFLLRRKREREPWIYKWRKGGRVRGWREKAVWKGDIGSADGVTSCGLCRWSSPVKRVFGLGVSCSLVFVLNRKCFCRFSFYFFPFFLCTTAIAYWHFCKLTLSRISIHPRYLASQSITFSTPADSAMSECFF